MGTKVRKKSNVNVFDEDYLQPGCERNALPLQRKTKRKEKWNTNIITESTTNAIVVMSITMSTMAMEVPKGVLRSSLSRQYYWQGQCLSRKT